MYRRKEEVNTQRLQCIKTTVQLYLSIVCKQMCTDGKIMINTKKETLKNDPPLKKDGLKNRKMSKV